MTTEVLAPVHIDELNLTLLHALAQDSRVSHRALARSTGMSAPAVSDRIAKLEAEGVIQGYTIQVNWTALGYQVVAYIAVNIGPGVDLADVILGLRAISEVEEVTVVTGSIDLIFRMRARDHKHLRELLLDHVFQVEGIQRTETYLSLGDNEPESFSELFLARMRSSGSVQPLSRSRETKFSEPPEEQR